MSILCLGWIQKPICLVNNCNVKVVYEKQWISQKTIDRQHNGSALKNVKTKERLNQNYFIAIYAWRLSVI